MKHGVKNEILHGMDLHVVLSSLARHFENVNKCDEHIRHTKDQNIENQMIKDRSRNVESIHELFDILTSGDAMFYDMAVKQYEERKNHEALEDHDHNVEHYEKSHYKSDTDKNTDTRNELLLLIKEKKIPHISNVENPFLRKYGNLDSKKTTWVWGKPLDFASIDELEKIIRICADGWENPKKTY